MPQAVNGLTTRRALFALPAIAAATGICVAFSGPATAAEAFTARICAIDPVHGARLAAAVTDEGLKPEWLELMQLYDPACPAAPMPRLHFAPPGGRYETIIISPGGIERRWRP